MRLAPRRPSPRKMTSILSPADGWHSFHRLQRLKPLLGGLARAVVAEPFEGLGEVGLGLLGVLGDEVGAASQKVAVAAFPEGPLGNVFAGKLRDDLRCFGLGEEGSFGLGSWFVSRLDLLRSIQPRLLLCLALHHVLGMLGE